MAQEGKLAASVSVSKLLRIQVSYFFCGQEPSDERPLDKTDFSNLQQHRQQLFETSGICVRAECDNNQSKSSMSH